MRVSYQKEMLSIIAGLGAASKVPRLMLHCCCAPCASFVLECLSEFFDITLFFHNPCIQPVLEYEKRLESLQKLLGSMKFPRPVILIDPEWRGEDFNAVSRGREALPEGGERCSLCFAQRLGETARRARDGEYDYFCSTLTVGPRKNAQAVNTAGFEQGKKFGVRWLPSDFKKGGGYRRSVELSKEYGIYRQNYCGCLISNINPRRQPSRPKDSAED